MSHRNAPKRGQQATVVVKVQMPLYPASRDGEALIYDEYRRHPQLRKLDEAEHKMVGRAMKVYCTAWWHDATGWVLLNRVPDKRW
jgi:hypothetical protein